MALYQPTNITPSKFAGAGSQCVDVNDKIKIAWQVNGGSPMTAFKISIYKNDVASTYVGDTGIVTCPAFYGHDAYGNPRFYEYAPNVTWSALTASGQYPMINGLREYMRAEVASAQSLRGTMYFKENEKRYIQFTPSSDMIGNGVLLYECATKRLTFTTVNGVSTIIPIEEKEVQPVGTNIELEPYGNYIDYKLKITQYWNGTSESVEQVSASCFSTRATAELFLVGVDKIFVAESAMAAGNYYFEARNRYVKFTLANAIPTNDKLIFNGATFTLSQVHGTTITAITSSSQTTIPSGYTHLDMPLYVSTAQNTFKANYRQSEGDALAWVRWQLAAVSSSGKYSIIDDTTPISTAILQYTFTGFMKGKHYAIQCTAETTSGAIVSTGWLDCISDYDTTDGVVTDRLTYKADDSVLVEWATTGSSVGVPATENYGEYNDGILHLFDGASIAWQSTLPTAWSTAYRGKLRRTVGSGLTHTEDVGTVVNTVSGTANITSAITLSFSKSIYKTAEYQRTVKGKTAGTYVEGKGYAYSVTEAFTLGAGRILSAQVGAPVMGSDATISFTDASYSVTIYDASPSVVVSAIVTINYVDKYYATFEDEASGIVQSISQIGTLPSGLDSCDLSYRNETYTVTGYTYSFDGQTASVTIPQNTIKIVYATSYYGVVTKTFDEGTITAASVTAGTTGGSCNISFTSHSYTVTFISYPLNTIAVATVTLTYSGESPSSFENQSLFEITKNSTNKLTASIASNKVKAVWVISGTTTTKTMATVIPSGTTDIVVICTRVGLTAAYYGENGFISSATLTYSLTEFSGSTTVSITGEQYIEWLCIESGDMGNEYERGKPVWNAKTLFLVGFDNESLQAGVAYNTICRAERDGNTMKRICAVPFGISSFRDYSAASQKAYTYYRFLTSDLSTFSTPIKYGEICKRFIGYSLIQAKPDDEQPNVYHVVDLFRFATNIDAGAVSNNNSPSWQQTFTGYRLRQPSSQRGQSGTLTALLSNVNMRTMEYEDTAEQQQRLFSASLSGDTFFIKDMKGNVRMVGISAPVTQTMRIASGVLPTTVTVQWEEVGTADDISIVSLPTDEYWKEHSVTYPIVVGIVNGSYSGATEISPSGTATVVITANSGYKLPNNVTITGASYSYSSTTGVITLYNPTGEVTIAAICTSAPEWQTPTITLSGDTLSTTEVSGVTRYKVYDGNTYIGYIDADGIWHTVV